MTTVAGNPDVVVIGAGAAGLFFAGEAGRRGLRVRVLDHAKRLAEKIRISGGGRCNFTNLGCGPEHFLSENPKFAVSALRRYSARDFLAHVEAAGLLWEEKAAGQLFCRNGAQDLIDMLFGQAEAGGAKITSGTTVRSVERLGGGFRIATDAGSINAPRLVIATGGKSIPKIGATGFGYDLARQFGLGVVTPRPALVPLTFEGQEKARAAALSGLAVKAAVTGGRPMRRRGKIAKPPAFRDGFLFTHRGLSGPSVLQASSYWREGEAISVDLAPDQRVVDRLKDVRAGAGKTAITTALAEFLPRRLVKTIAEEEGWSGPLADWSDRRIDAVAARLHQWAVIPAGSEGYRTAEVTLGGVDTDGLDSKTMEAKAVPGLYFIGEVVDVTGWLGGYNFQWAWSSAVAAARHLGPDEAA